MFRNELCRGFNLKSAAKALVDAGWIEPGNDGKSSQMQRIFAMENKSIRVYVFRSEKMAVE